MKFSLRHHRYHVLIAAGLVWAYLMACLWWHHSGIRWVYSLGSYPRDPFATPTGRDALVDRAMVAGNLIFFDIRSW